MVQTWYDTLAWIKANPDQAVVVLASAPGRIAADLPVPLNLSDPHHHPRRSIGGPGSDRQADAEFLALRAEVEDLVRLYHRRHTVN